MEVKTVGNQRLRISADALHILVPNITVVVKNVRIGIEHEIMVGDRVVARLTRLSDSEVDVGGTPWVIALKEKFFVYDIKRGTVDVAPMTIVSGNFVQLFYRDKWPIAARARLEVPEAGSPVYMLIYADKRTIALNGKFRDYIRRLGPTYAAGGATGQLDPTDDVGLWLTGIPHFEWAVVFRPIEFKYGEPSAFSVDLVTKHGIISYAARSKEVVTVPDYGDVNLRHAYYLAYRQPLESSA